MNMPCEASLRLALLVTSPRPAGHPGGHFMEKGGKPQPFFLVGFVAGGATGLGWGLGSASNSIHFL